MATDLIVRAHGSIMSLTPQNPGAKQWLLDCLPEDCPRLGGSWCVEARYLRPIVRGLRADGFIVEYE
jgi:hypothetical protein